MAKVETEGKKRYYQQDRVGSAKYTISYHDGKKKHKDGSDFFDIQTFRNKKDLAKFVNALHKGGYKYGFGESVNEAMKPSQVRSAISKVKKQLMRKWKQKGGYENFGQKELSQMRDKFDYNPYGSSDERQIAKMLDAFDNWAMNYDGNMRESVNEAIKYNKDGFVTKMENEAGKVVKDITLDGEKFVLKGNKYVSKKGGKDLHKSHFGIKESINEVLVIVDKFDKKRQDYGKIYYQDGGNRPGDGDIKKANKELAKLSKKHKGLTLVSVGRNSKMYDVNNPRESVNESFFVMYQKKGVFGKPAAVKYKDKKTAEKFAKDLERDGYNTMILDRQTMRNVKGVKVTEAKNKESKAIQVMHKYSKTERKFYDKLADHERRIGPRDYKKFIEKALRGFGLNPSKFKTIPDAEEKMYQIAVKESISEDLRKWFGKGKTGSSTGGGWDRYGSDGQKLGKCGDGKKGGAYAACLSKEKAAKLGAKGRASFVRRKRADQKKAGDAKKGGNRSKGKKPTFSKTGT